MHHVISVTELGKQLMHRRVEPRRPTPEHLRVWRGRWQLCVQDTLAWAASASAPRCEGVTQRVEDAHSGIGVAQLCQLVCHKDILLLPVEAHQRQARHVCVHRAHE